MNPPGMRNIMSGTIILPYISMWGRGFNVRRPRDFAVGSPKKYATRPWAYSWRTTAANNGTNINERL
jgi:hypothetical protein